MWRGGGGGSSWGEGSRILGSALVARALSRAYASASLAEAAQVGLLGGAFARRPAQFVGDEAG